MDRNAGKERDGAVQIEVKEKANKAAHEVSKDPAITHDVTGHKEWQ